MGDHLFSFPIILIAKTFLLIIIHKNKFHTSHVNCQIRKTFFLQKFLPEEVLWFLLQILQVVKNVTKTSLKT